MLDERSYRLLTTIVQHYQATKHEVLRILDISERQFNYDLDKLNYALKNLKLPPITLQGYTFILEKELIDSIESGELKKRIPNMLTLSKEERIYLLYLYTFIRKEPISNYHYQTFLGISKNTALDDVKRAKELCNEWNLNLVYTRIDGYHLQGDEFDKRRLALHAVGVLQGTTLGSELLLMPLKEWGFHDLIKDTTETFSNIIEKYSIKLVKSRKNEILPFLAYLRARMKPGAALTLQDYQKKFIADQPVFLAGQEIAHSFFGNNYENEEYFVTLLLEISMQVANYENNLLKELVDQIILEFERITLLPLENKEILKKSLYDHLEPALFRILFNIPLVNPLTERVKKEYPELFDLVKIALNPLSRWTGQEISEEEIGYFTIHFGGYLEKGKRNNSKKINGLIICSNGISSSLMLKAQLNEMFPMINFLSIHSVDQITDLPKSMYDLIFSTVKVSTDKPVFYVKPLLSQVEKNYLMQEVSYKFPSLNDKPISVDQIMQIVKKHADIRDESKLFSELVDLIYFKGSKKGRYSPMLSELLTLDMINITDQKLEWKEGIQLAAKPLIDSGKIEPNYVDAMIKNVETMGAYIHIGKGIAIPHARPQDGVNQVGMSFLRTKNPVLLLDKEEHQIDIFICIAAIDNETHLRALAQLTKILGDNQKLEALKNAKTSSEIEKLIQEGEKNL